MPVQFCLALLALSYLTAASDPGCEELLKPLEDRSQVSGRWIFHAGTSNNEKLLKALRTINSSLIELASLPDSDDMTLRWGDRIGGICHAGGVNFTFSQNSTKVTLNFNASDHEHVGKHLVSCPDCLVWTDTTVSHGEATTGKTLYIFTKTGKLDDSHLEVFKKQAACLNFPAEFHFGESTDICPFENEAATDVKEGEQ
ncbi:uncharacterized protein LOC129101600 [Anoplopoma fimbria]|uniref:uncharacterized protein LOC129101600 n=1 Tax=Anoplopoma fimbria TaxID=229290 RepID=UPI0023EBF2EC|nr:uncharacterized protein LOC129101600 [Anoplopoma fimbria]